MELGKLLDHWRFIFLIDHSADRRMVDHPKFFNDHFANIFIHFLVDLFLGNTLGCWRIDVRLGYEISWNVTG